jgi:hypothetical protein
MKTETAWTRSCPGADHAFEQEVRRAAGLMYPDHYGGATIADDLERDGVSVTEDTVVLIEVRTARASMLSRFREQVPGAVRSPRQCPAGLAAN